MVDCGVAPGLSNILFGDLARRLDRIDRYDCYVGGLPQTRCWPFEYKAVFSPVDVLEEYTPVSYTHLDVYKRQVYDLENGKRTETPVNYDARDLVTHAVCVGMTGSGKTGLCIGLLEEAAIDRVPALLIDPKGDITNLLLQFPELRPEDFEPWINADDARRKDKSVEEFAASTAETWRNGLADWGINGERMKLLAEQTQYTIFTPGSEMGTPLNICLLYTSRWV